MSVLTCTRSNLIDVISNCKAFYTSQRRVSPPHSATMTVYARVARTAGRTAVRAQRRQMGGSHAPAPEWTGIDKVVRGYFPEDYQREFCRQHEPDAITVCWRARRVEAGTKLRARPTEMRLGGSGGGWKEHAWWEKQLDCNGAINMGDVLSGENC